MYIRVSQQQQSTVQVGQVFLPVLSSDLQTQLQVSLQPPRLARRAGSRGVLQHPVTPQRRQVTTPCRKSPLWLFSFSVFSCWCRSCLVRCHLSPLDSRDAGSPPSCRSHFCVFPLGSLSLGDLVRFAFC